MVTLIHGNDFVSSRNFFNQEKEADYITLDAENIDKTDLEQLLSGSSLFGQRKKVLIENLFGRKAAKNFKEVIDFLSRTKDLDIYIWADREVPKSQLSDFPKYEDKNFKIPQNIFNFVDKIYPGSTGNVSNFHEILKNAEPEFIFTMIIRQFRLMIGISDGLNSNAEEVKRLRDWQIDKLKRQASLFGAENLKTIYKKIYKIDKSQKTGASKLNLVQAIDILLLQI